LLEYGWVDVAIFGAHQRFTAEFEEDAFILHAFDYIVQGLTLQIWSGLSNFSKRFSILRSYP
jgi:hypothetical protein